MLSHPPIPPAAAQKLLAEALRLAQHPPEPDHRPAWQAKLIEIRAQLSQFAHPLLDTTLPIADIPLETRFAFVKACILLNYYPQLGAAEWSGTLIPQTLHRFQPEAIPPSLAQAQALDSLWNWFDLPFESLLSFQAELTELSQELERQQQVIAQVHQAILQTSALNVFQALFSPLAIPEACLKWGSTGWQLYFCLSYEDHCLYTETDNGTKSYQAWNQLLPEQRDDIQLFLQEIQQFQYDKFERFPIFGACQPEQINRNFIETVASQSGSTPSQVVRILSRSVSILPTANAEAFLIHDIWGHHWQLWLTSFLNDYEFLSVSDQPLWPGETAYTPHGPLACRDLFRIEHGRVSLDQDRGRSFFHGEVQQRLGFLLTHLLGEILADVAEFKFAYHFPDEVDRLQSSSLFANSPAKLDLSLLDIDFLFLRVLKPLLDVQLSVFTSTDLETGLRGEWDSHPDAKNLKITEFELKTLIAELYHLFFQEFQAYAPQVDHPSGFFATMIFNLLHLQNVINSLYHHPLAESELPIRDLLLVFVGCYCSQDCYQEFWTIDDALAHYFLPCGHHLRAWLNMQNSIT